MRLQSHNGIRLALADGAAHALNELLQRHLGRLNRLEDDERVVDADAHEDSDEARK